MKQSSRLFISCGCSCAAHLIPCQSCHHVHWLPCQQKIFQKRYTELQNSHIHEKYVLLFCTLFRLLFTTPTTGYITSILWCWSRAGVNWEGCDSKGIWHKISGSLFIWSPSVCRCSVGMPASGLRTGSAHGGKLQHETPERLTTWVVLDKGL